jgi:hypothetical protein
MDAQQRDDLVPVVVVGVLFVWYVVRWLIPALILGQDVGVRVGVAAMLACTVGLTIAPCVRRSKHRAVGHL